MALCRLTPVIPVLLDESRRWDSASSLCRARSFLRLATSSKSALAVEGVLLETGGVKVGSIGGFVLSITISYY